MVALCHRNSPQSEFCFNYLLNFDVDFVQRPSDVPARCSPGRSSELSGPQVTRCSVLGYLAAQCSRAALGSGAGAGAPSKGVPDRRPAGVCVRRIGRGRTTRREVAGPGGGATIPESPASGRVSVCVRKCEGSPYHRAKAT
ncbi:hypothetical protein FTUN_6373 [Frigoriglobus tundricola]|uniref:Uncharacterized protein n=1 Tax=Frigoriglobus tundricola TaxID=2774151 RepID=A0A6M5YY29_9BACT|nr:hypothetical protein FTUN_6373 [Frigoriglobus tundricola]